MRLINPIASGNRSSGFSRAAAGSDSRAAATTDNVCPTISTCSIFTLSKPISSPMG